MRENKKLVVPNNWKINKKYLSNTTKSEGEYKRKTMNDSSQISTVRREKRVKARENSDLNRNRPQRGTTGYITMRDS